MAYIEFKDVIKAYGEGDARIHALDGASFTVERGELAIILGASGAGKTTALNILGGMDTATSGTVTVDGRDVSSANEAQLVEYRRADVGFVFQFYNLVPNLTALENVELAAQICLIRSMPNRRFARSAWVSASPTFRRSFRAASSSACPSPAHWQRTPSCFCATSPRARLTTKLASRSCSCCRIPAASRALRSSSSPTTPRSRPWPIADSL